ncbi:MAG: hypothetical protein ACK5CE_15710 [Actinomycetes bacterium]|jgi:hypothetical protein|uniref:Unannotated protein n=1 Tax=freshwater metagenome TaxID=449393 RepID=A0A6J6FAI5_9ZZZZ|nr:hypothetical protein [Actinomycetota bacterium]
MNLSDPTPTELLDLSTLLDHHHAASGDIDAPRWCGLVHEEVARRFAALEEGGRLQDEARAARGG